MKEGASEFEKFAAGAGVFRQRLRMASVQVEGLGEEELRLALAYEVEPFSGIAAGEAEVCFRAVPDEDPSIRAFDVAVRARTRGGRGGRGRSGGRRWNAVPIGVCLLAIALGVDAVLLGARERAARRTVTARRPLQQQLDSLRQKAQAVRREADEMRSRREQAVRAQERAAVLRSAHAEALGALATACARRSVVTAIGPEGERQDGLSVRAVGASAATAAETMQVLTALLAGKGWTVLPEGLAAQGAGAAVEFGFCLRRKE